jgi:hypothetical protein
MVQSRRQRLAEEHVEPAALELVPGEFRKGVWKSSKSPGRQTAVGKEEHWIDTDVVLELVAPAGVAEGLS